MEKIKKQGTIKAVCYPNLKGKDITKIKELIEEFKKKGFSCIYNQHIKNNNMVKLVFKKTNEPQEHFYFTADAETRNKAFDRLNEQGHKITDVKADGTGFFITTKDTIIEQFVCLYPEWTQKDSIDGFLTFTKNGYKFTFEYEGKMHTFYDDKKTFKGTEFINSYGMRFKLKGNI